MNYDVDWENKLLSKAEKYYNSFDEIELEKLLAEEWRKAENINMPVRSDDNPGIRIAKRLIKELTQQSEVISASAGLIASKVITHLKATGYDLSDFEVPIIIMVALIVKSTLAEWRNTK